MVSTCLHRRAQAQDSVQPGVGQGGGLRPEVSRHNSSRRHHRTLQHRMRTQVCRVDHFSAFALDLTSANSRLTLTWAGGTWPARASARPSAAWVTGPWKYTAPRSSAPTERPRRWTTATAAGSTNPTTRKVATATATRAGGTTLPGPR